MISLVPFVIKKKILRCRSSTPGPIFCHPGGSALTRPAVLSRLRGCLRSAGHKFLKYTVYPKKYAHGFCFAVLCCGYTLTDFPISIRLTSLALWQSNNCPSASKATLMNMDQYFMWIHYERLHNHNKAKHNKTVCIFLGIYCDCHSFRIGKATDIAISGYSKMQICIAGRWTSNAYKKIYQTKCHKFLISQSLDCWFAPHNLDHAFCSQSSLTQFQGFRYCRTGLLVLLI